MDDTSVVLLVEDNPDDSDLIAYAFREVGIANPLTIVDDGDKAVAYLHGEAPFADRGEHPLPGVVLLDLKLPRRSGFEVLADIRSVATTRRIPVVVLTSSNQEADIGRAYDLGANSYLIKPIGRDALIAMVKSIDDFWIKLNQTAAS